MHSLIIPRVNTSSGSSTMPKLPTVNAKRSSIQSEMRRLRSSRPSKLSPTTRSTSPSLWGLGEVAALTRSSTPAAVIIAVVLPVIMHKTYILRPGVRNLTINRPKDYPVGTLTTTSLCERRHRVQQPRGQNQTLTLIWTLHMGLHILQPCRGTIHQIPTPTTRNSSMAS